VNLYTAQTTRTDGNFLIYFWHSLDYSKTRRLLKVPWSRSNFCNTATNILYSRNVENGMLRTESSQMTGALEETSLMYTAEGAWYEYIHTISS